MNKVISHRQHLGKTFPNIFFAQDTKLQNWIQNS
jgi:hypothetical protein